MIEHDFAAFLKPEIKDRSKCELRMATIQAYNVTTKRASIYFAGDSTNIISDVSVMHSYVPVAGNFCIVLVQDAAMVIIGTVAF